MLRLRLLLTLILGVCVINVAHAQPRTSTSHKVVVVVANRLVLSDFKDPSLRSLYNLYQHSSAGFISPNCQGWKNEWSVMLTAGSGTGCRGGFFAKDCYDADEILPDEARRAGDVYAARTGRTAKSGSAVFLSLGLADKANAELTRPIKIGALGDTLHEAGKKTCAVGNADLDPLHPDRSAAVLAMDSNGLIDVGLLASRSSNQDCGICSDIDALVKTTENGLSKADFVVVNYGDTTRLDEMKSSISDSAYASHKIKVMKGLDKLIRSLEESSSSNDYTLILASFSPPNELAWSRLSPIFVYPKLGHDHILCSPTTRSYGLIAASDFAPTVLSMMDIQPSVEMLGRTAATTPSPETLDDLDTRVTTFGVLFAPVSWAFGILGIVSFTAAAVLAAFRFRVPAWTPKTIRLTMLAGSTGPLAILLAVLAPSDVASHAAAVFVGAAVLTLISLAVAGRSKASVSHALPVRIVFGMTVLALLVDACTNGSLARFSILGACQISAFRYYGIGNEYAGMLLSMGAMVALFSGRRRWLAPLIGLLIIITMGSGRWGANYGATIAAVITFGLLSMVAWRGGFSARHVIGITFLSCVVVVVMALIDARLFGIAGSHAGRAAAFAEQIGPSYISDLVGRKILLNLGIAGMKHVRGIFFAFLPFLLLWFYFIQGKVKRMFQGTPVFAGLKAILIGSVGALLFNDSGIVFAAIMVVMMVLVLLYSLLESRDVAGEVESSEREGVVRV